MLVLDLDSTDRQPLPAALPPSREQYTRTESYSGQPFIFNMIHTFGGQLALFGRAGNTNRRPAEARALHNSTMVGTGFAMEGIHNSYVMYELLSEASWREGPVEDLDLWFLEYAHRR
jgi:alpha-N-acetylglucosaminidase